MNCGEYGDCGCGKPLKDQANVGSESSVKHGGEGQPETDPRDQSVDRCRSCSTEKTVPDDEVEYRTYWQNMAITQSQRADGWKEKHDKLARNYTRLLELVVSLEELHDKQTALLNNSEMRCE